MNMSLFDDPTKRSTRSPLAASLEPPERSRGNLPRDIEHAGEAEPLRRFSPGSVAIMQPYFFPYAGYFRLFAVCDLFVIFDCVQFPRRGRVHRSQIGGDAERPTWLTLPLERQPRETLIRDLRFVSNAREELRRRIERVTWLNEASGPAAAPVRELLDRPASSVIDYLEDSLRMVAELLAFDIEFVRSSSLAIDPELRGQDRVIAIASAVGAKRYVNSPGGRQLYDAAAFAGANMELSFLSFYTGPFTNMLHALMTEERGAIRTDIINSSTLEVVTPHLQ